MISHVLASYLTELSYSDLDPVVIHQAKRCLLDTIGCTIGAQGASTGRRIVDYVVRAGGSNGASVFGEVTKVPSENAALANATLAHTLESDDGHRPSDNHLGCVVVPAALATVEEVGASGADLLTAIVVGYDIMGRVGESVVNPRLGTAFHGTGTCGPFGAAAAAAKAMGLSTVRTAHAFGIAGVQSAGLRQVLEDGPECKPLHAGKAAHSGILAAKLAQSDFTGPEAILEGRYGFCNAMTSEPNLAALTANLGTVYEVGRVGFKIHATCGMLFCPIDATLALRSELGTRVDEVRKIVVGMPSSVLVDPAFTSTNLQSAAAARFSIPYGVALALAFGRVSELEISEKALKSASVESLMRRVELVEDTEVERIRNDTIRKPFFFYPARVTIEFDSSSLSRLVVSPRGYDPALPVSDEELVDKFNHLVEPVIGGVKARDIVNRVNHVEQLDSVAELTQLFAQ